MRPLIRTYGADLDARRIMLTDLPDYLSFEELAERLYADRKYGLRKIDTIVVRPRVDTPLTRAQIDELNISPFLTRAPHASLHLLFSTNFSITITENLNPGAAAPFGSADTPGFLGWLKQLELQTLVETSGALFPPHTNWLYKTPNNRYANMFLRVGNVQKSRQALDAFFFWLIPYLAEVDSMLSETWSISSIVLNAARLLERYRFFQSSTEQPCRVDMLSSYHDRRPVVVAETKDALHRVTNRVMEGPHQDQIRNTLVLLSAVSTGNSLRQLRQTIEEYQEIERFRFVSLYRLTKACDIDALCDLSNGVRGVFFEVDRSPRQFDPIVEIDREAYFPRQPIEARDILLGRRHADPSKRFFSDYKGIGAVTIHRDARDQNAQLVRHHGIYIDVTALTSSEKFRVRLDNELGRLPQAPCIVLTPPHQAAQSLTQTVLEFLERRNQTKPEVFFRTDLLESQMQSRLANLQKDDLVLIIDDVSINGWRLKQYQKALRTMQCRARVAYLVGVARPPYENDWGTLVRELAHRPTAQNQPNIAVAVELVVLPNWHDDECPWCQEELALSELRKKVKANSRTEATIVERLHLLNRAKLGNGLFTDVFWTLSPGEVPKLTSGSLFLDHEGAEAADVAGAVASTLQKLRAPGPDHLQAEYPYVVILGDANYLAERFNDVVLRCALLRCAYRQELEYWTDRRERLRMKRASDLVSKKEPDSGALHLEMAVAILGAKVPPIRLGADGWQNLGATSAEVLEQVSKD